MRHSLYCCWCRTPLHTNLLSWVTSLNISSAIDGSQNTSSSWIHQQTAIVRPRFVNSHRLSLRFVNSHRLSLHWDTPLLWDGCRIMSGSKDHLTITFVLNLSPFFGQLLQFFHLFIEIFQLFLVKVFL